MNNTPNLDDAREFLYSLQKKELQSDILKRGPFLAELELEKRVISEMKDCKPAKEMDTLAIEYFRRFGEKACCFVDLQPYLKGIPLETSKKIIEGCKTSIDSTCENVKVRFSYSFVLNLYMLSKSFFRL